MKSHDVQPDPKISTEEERYISTLSMEEIQSIDRTIYDCTSSSWRKVTMVVGTVLLQLKITYPGLSDLYLAQRVRNMVTQGVLEHQGFLENMRYSEVRRVK
jgi:hypothetical protein